MDIEKIIDSMLSGNCYQVDGMQLTGCGDRVKVYVPRRGSCFISVDDAVQLIKAAAAVNRYICRR